ncbi:MAG: metallophosphoesterase [Roseburia sp.]|nr:metallophosphoesterase [Roseburia sp.]
MMVLWVLIGIAVILLIVGIVDGNRFEVVRETFTLPDLLRDCRFVLISDLHNKVYGNRNDKVIAAVREINPDFILLAGDMVTSKVSEDMTPAIELVQALCREYRVYYGLGNHETKMKCCRKKFGDKYKALEEAVTVAGAVLLDNTSRMLSEYNVVITGLELELEYFAHFKKARMAEDYLNKAIGRAQSHRCNILIAHNPDYFEEYAAWGADLVVSGHVHGGIMRLPVLGGVIAPSYTLFPKYDGGVFREGASVMLLGRGMGSHTLPFRFFNPAQLYAVELKKGE